MDTPESPILLDRVPSKRGDYFCLVYLRKGSGVFTIAESALALLSPSFLCLGFGERCSLPKDCEFQQLYFKPVFVDSRFENPENLRRVPEVPMAERYDLDALRPFIKTPRLSTAVIRLLPLELEGIDRAFRELLEIFENSTARYRPCRARSILLSLLFTLGYRTESFPAIGEAPASALVSEVLRHLHHSFTGPVLIEQLCRRFATNRNTLCREFRCMVGKSIGTYVRDLRINLAERLLAQTSLPIIQIASRCGYEDPSHFSRVFRTVTGSSPVRWRSDQRSS